MAMELDLIRKELNKYDEAIRTLITIRMSLIPIVTDIKVQNDLPLFQSKREDEIYKKIDIFSKENGIDETLLKDIYRLIISGALRLEERIAEDPNSSVISDSIDISNAPTINKAFERLDTVVSETIPEIITEIKNSTELNGLKLLEKSTVYYNEKVNRPE